MASKFVRVPVRLATTNCTISKALARQPPTVRLYCSATGPSGPVKSYVKTWWTTKLCTWALVGSIPIGLVYPNRVTDVVLATTLVAHQQLGLSAIVTDYVNPRALGGLAKKSAQGTVLILSAATLGGLLHLTFNDIGLSNTIRKIWTVKPKEQRTQ
ncbi:succinate dehydrogenase [ubiquinone] cytochrome b small subunit, mitochondrial-like [Topomyia yanbarensis]|uniref:succinate dehydrogenase [ubiquinone] cytochrome b small subunit, mitochondrial-like n=1 Tax=Topomyia yanbarensis TaxID=2498891 RepID=UPI00273C92BF|nr:succinate dehydrogenase [ubiquinone] cytochrome b small subunit, mitochondrial-like [Topomyia yanbarensis]